MAGIPLRVFHGGPVGRLFTANTCDPALLIFQGAVQWFYFTDAAAFFPVFYRFIKAVRALFGHKLFHIRCLGRIYFDGFFVPVEGSVPHVIGFIEHPSSNEGEHPDGKVRTEERRGGKECVSTWKCGW